MTISGWPEATRSATSRRIAPGRTRAGGAADGGDDAVGAGAVAAVLDLDEARCACRADAGATRGPGRRARGPRRTDRSLAGADRRRHLVGGADERLHARVEIGELARVEVDRAAGDVDPLGALQRAADRLARLGLGLGGDAARVDDVQLGLGLRHFGVAGGQQGPAGEHRIRLGDLAAEELDRERGHAPQKLARDLVLRFSCDSHSQPADRRTPRSRRRAAVSSGRHG